MAIFSGWRQAGGLFGNDNANGPWGNRGGGSGGDDGGNGGGGEGSGGGGPRNPWQVPPPGKRPTPGGGRGPTALDELLKRAKGGMPRTPGGRPIWPIALGLVLVAWLFLTAVHRIGPQERGVILRFGQYAGTLQPGMGFTFPWPIDSLRKIDVEEIRTEDIPQGTGAQAENLMLTRDQNIVDLQYSVRWNIRDPERYLFQLAEPQDTVRESAESAMRAVIATVTLNEAIGSGRGDVEQRVATIAQAILNDYRSGVAIQGVAIKQADPPTAVIDAFKRVSAAQQTAETYQNQARAYAQQLDARAQGEAAAFNKVYEEYRLAPEVTRRRMYYETMERVLSKVDKTIVEAPGVTPYLPLPQVQRGSRPQPQPQQAPGAAR